MYADRYQPGAHVKIHQGGHQQESIPPADKPAGVSGKAIDLDLVELRTEMTGQLTRRVEFERCRRLSVVDEKCLRFVLRLNVIIQTHGRIEAATQ